MTGEDDMQRPLAEIARFPDMNPEPVLRMDFKGDILLSNVAVQKLFGEVLHGKTGVISARTFPMRYIGTCKQFSSDLSRQWLLIIRLDDAFVITV